MMFQIYELPTWGPAFTISFQFKVQQFDDDKKSLIWITDKSLKRKLPAIFTEVDFLLNTGGSLLIQSEINGQLYNDHIHGLTVNKWYKLFVSRTYKVNEVNLLSFNPIRLGGCLRVSRVLRANAPKPY